MNIPWDNLNDFEPGALNQNSTSERTITVPHSLQAEQSLLGALLMNNRMHDHIDGVLDEHDFYRHEHRIVFVALVELITSGREGDVVTVYEHLVAKGLAQGIGGIPFLNTLAQYVPSVANIRRYAEIIREQAVLRKLLIASAEISDSVFNREGREVDVLIDEAEQKIFGIGEEGGQRATGPVAMSKLIMSVMDRVQARSEAQSDVTGIATGFRDIDRMTAGMQEGDLIVIAARPSIGKTAFAVNIAEHVARIQKLPVVIFSLEMGANQLADRLTCSMGRIDASRFRTGKLTDEDWLRFSEAAEEMARMPLHIDETVSITPSLIRSNSRRLAREHGKLGLIVIDYLQLMSSNAGAHAENRATELADISRGLKMLAKELRCPVIALSQLNRSVEARVDKRPMMSDIRESGAIEQDADTIMFLYRDEYYSKDACEEPGVAEVIIGKQRNGPTGTVKLAFISSLTRFESLARAT
ncbi:replicative DNA helicase [Hydrogenophaga laconesensis]|uniref:Replicative DNA helicase n=1 Tax=Hydrogenophaga laconesensis TaxID=1805971 RepID=A0ABU1VJ27_9BURK|nr:replicative DNA helicase [Hydrogenophaga laconesensis]MDR7097488.1 replicative DNA helicase [Hydrogenophaga laconesensis]